MELILHIGAHRTGTTAMQDMLVANAGVLADAGVTALVHDGLEDRVPGLTRLARREDWATPRAAFEAETQGARVVLISDENIIGDMGWNLRAATFYPNARARLEAWRDFLGQAPARIGLAIRSYESYWISAHALELSYRPAPKSGVTRFAEARDGLAGLARGWRALAEDVAAVFPESTLMVWPVEARLPVEAAAARLIGADLGLAPPPAGVNAAPEAGLIPVMEEKRAERPGIGRAAMRDWLATQSPRPFAGFNAAQSAAMATRYEADIAGFAAGHAGAELLAAPKARAA